MPRLRFLMEQLERAQRFAASLTNAADRDRLNEIAAGYQREIDSLKVPESGPPPEVAGGPVPSEGETVRPENEVAESAPQAETARDSEPPKEMD